MANLNIPLIRTTQEIPDDLNSFKDNTQLINWSTANVEDVPTNIRFHYSATGGTTSALTWDRTLGCTFEEGKNNLWAISNQGEQIRVNVNTGSEYYLICKVKMDEGRHFGPFNKMGWEFFQSHDSNNSLFLRKIGRFYKHPETNEIWSFSSAWNGESFKESRGYFFATDRIVNIEKSHLEEGYILNEIYFQFRSTSGVGSSHSSYVEIFDMRLGWDLGFEEDNKRICLPKIRPFSQANQLTFGDD